MNDLQAAEIAGFFWGEGCLSIDILSRKHAKNSIRVRARVALRADDADILYTLQEWFGGHVTSHNNASTKRSPTLAWQIQDKDEVEEFLNVLEQSSSLPAKKRKEITLVREVIDIMRNKGYRYSDDDLDRIEFLKDKLSRLKSYS